MLNRRLTKKQLPMKKTKIVFTLAEGTSDAYSKWLDVSHGNILQTQVFKVGETVHLPQLDTIVTLYLRNKESNEWMLLPFDVVDISQNMPHSTFISHGHPHISRNPFYIVSLVPGFTEASVKELTKVQPEKKSGKIVSLHNR